MRKSKITDAAKKPETGPFGPIYRQFEGEPHEALAWIRSKKDGIAVNAIFHKELGGIGLPWGRPGTAAKGFHDGNGVSHIDAAHKGYLDANIDRIGELPIIQRFHDKAGNLTAAVLSDGRYRAVVSRDFKGKATDQWLLTSYEQSAPGTSVRVPEAPPEEVPNRLPQQPTARHHPPKGR